ncbi:MAG: LamG-like jellyroll fold domain-containing protein [Bacteroidota bacterium]|nr:LamG-like jellyroll fold domain-containing protein [Bacteroidota bacterium]
MKTKQLLFVILSILCFNNVVEAQAPTAGLISYWPFNGNADDASGNNHNGVVNGATLTNDRFGNPNKAYSFNGINNNIVVADANDLSFVTNEFTVSFWIYSNSTSNIAILGKRGSTTSDFEYLFRKVVASDPTYGNKLAISNWNLAGTAYPYLISASNYTVDDTIAAQQWENWTVTANGTILKAYKNGTFKFSYARDPGTSLANGPGSLTIGSGGAFNTTYYMNGKLDDIRIYNRALDSMEVNAIANEVICSQTIYDTVHVAVTDTLIINANLTGINPPNNYNTLKIFPNPTSDYITINTGNFSVMNGYQIKIINTLSQVVYTQTINAASYSVALNTFGGLGTYFVQLFDAQNNLIDVRKIILQ